MEAGAADFGLGADTSIVEGLTRYSWINSNEDDAIGVASTIFRDMQREASSTNASENLVSKVKGTLANKEVLDNFEFAGHQVRSDVQTLAGKYVDPVVVLTSSHTTTVYTLNAAGDVVTTQRAFPAGSVLTIETKSLRLSTWQDARQIDTLVDEVQEGFQHLSDLGKPDDFSLAAVSRDLLDDTVRLKSILQRIRSLSAPLGNRAEIVALTRYSVGPNSYGSQARGVIKNLQP